MATPFKGPNAGEIASQNDSTSELRLVEDQEIDQAHEAYEEEGDEEMEGQGLEKDGSDGEGEENGEEVGGEVVAEDASETDDSDALYDVEEERSDDEEPEMSTQDHYNIYKKIVNAGLRLQQFNAATREEDLIFLSDCVLNMHEVKYLHKREAAWQLFNHASLSEYQFEDIANMCIGFIIEILAKRQLNERSRLRRTLEREKDQILDWLEEITEERQLEKARERERLQLDEDPVLFHNPRTGETEPIAQQPFRTADPEYPDEDLDQYSEDDVWNNDNIAHGDPEEIAERMYQQMLQQCDDDEEGDNDNVNGGLSDIDSNADDESDADMRDYSHYEDFYGFSDSEVEDTEDQDEDAEVRDADTEDQDEGESEEVVAKKHNGYIYAELSSGDEMEEEDEESGEDDGGEQGEEVSEDSDDGMDIGNEEDSSSEEEEEEL